jgi:predicted lipoprotein with Yx(FWY)xxD motif
VTGVVTRSTLVRIALLAALAATVAAVAAGSGLAGASHVTKAAATVKTRKIKGLGQVLVNGKGFTLYIFVPDHHKKVTCKGGCAAVWPPLKVKKGHKPTAGGLAKKSKLGLDGRVVTYNHWPLYTYVTDTAPGQAKGQGVNNFGLWYVISPSGKVIKKSP